MTPVCWKQFIMLFGGGFGFIPPPPARPGSTKGFTSVVLGLPLYYLIRFLFLIVRITGKHHVSAGPFAGVVSVFVRAMQCTLALHKSMTPRGQSLFPYF